MWLRAVLQPSWWWSIVQIKLCSVSKKWKFAFVNRIAFRFRHFFDCQLSKKCIPFYQRCDGYQDCSFREDENDCQGSFEQKSSFCLIDFVLEFKCNSSSSFRCSTDKKCITKDDLCNNITDCVHGEDENDVICGHYCEWPSLNTCTSKTRVG